MEGHSTILPSEVEAFKERAKVEMQGETGEFQMPYLSFAITVFCDKGIPKKIKIATEHRAIWRNVAIFCFAIILR